MSRFMGKIVMAILAGYMQVPLKGILLFVALGHIFDIAYPRLKYKIESKYRSQRSTEKVVFLYAYCCYFLGLSYETANQSLLNNTSINPGSEDSVSNLLKYYLEKYLPRSLKYKVGLEKIDKKIDQVIKLLKVNPGNEDVFTFINLLEEALSNQEYNTSSSQYEMLVRLCKMFGVNYIVREQAEEYQSSKDYYQQARHQDYNDDRYANSHTDSYEQNSYQNYTYQEYEEEEAEQNSYTQEDVQSDYISPEVKQAYEMFNLKPSRDYPFEEIKKIYKVYVKQYHPDILKGRGATDDELEKADDKLAELNKSIDIIKKFLAKG